MRRIAFALVATAALCAASSAPAAGWTTTVGHSDTVASSPTPGWGYPASNAVPVAPGTCTSGTFNSNRSESWLAVKPGTEDAVGTSKFFFDKYSTFYMFYLGAYQILGGTWPTKTGTRPWVKWTSSSLSQPTAV